MPPKEKRSDDAHGALLCGIAAGEKGLGAHFKETERKYVARKTKAIYEHQPPLWYPQMDWKDLPSGRPPVAHRKQNQVTNVKNSMAKNNGRASFGDNHRQSVKAFMTAIMSRTIPPLASLEAMERIMIRGIEGAVGVVMNTIHVSGSPKPSFSSIRRDGLRLPPGFEMTDMEISGAMPFKEEYNSLLFGRRFWAIKFHFCSGGTNSPCTSESILSNPQEQHWATALFDRRSSTFIYFDTKDQHRDIRAKAAALAWRAYLTNFELLYDFYLFSPPLTEQHSDCDSACLSFFMLYQAVRTHVGQGLNDIFDSAKKKLKVVIDGNRCKNRPSLACDIRLRDWGALGETPSKAYATVANILTTICMHELGELCHRPDQDCKWIQTININRYRTAMALDTVGDSIDFGGPACFDLPDGKTHSRGYSAKRLFQKRAAPQAGWYMLPALPSFINTPPTSDMIPDEDVELMWKTRSKGKIPPGICAMLRGESVKRGRLSSPQLTLPCCVDEQDQSELASPARLESPDVLSGSTFAVPGLDNPPWCPPRGDMPEWRSIWTGLASARQ